MEKKTVPNHAPAAGEPKRAGRYLLLQGELRNVRFVDQKDNESDSNGLTPFLALEPAIPGATGIREGLKVSVVVNK